MFTLVLSSRSVPRHPLIVPLQRALIQKGNSMQLYRHPSPLPPDPDGEPGCSPLPPDPPPAAEPAPVPQVRSR
jgi:hypothetical protein